LSGGSELKKGPPRTTPNSAKGNQEKEYRGELRIEGTGVDQRGVSGW